jgi:hypothetical protein
MPSVSRLALATTPHTIQSDFSKSALVALCISLVLTAGGYVQLKKS